MSLLEVIELIGYSTGAALHLWMGTLLWQRWQSLQKIERIVLALAVVVGIWHASNLILTLHKSLGLASFGEAFLLRAVNTLAVVTVTLAYSLLLHVHLYLWANARRRALTKTERVRVYLSYIPILFLSIAVPSLWSGEYAPLLEKNAHLVLPFALWAIYVLGLVAATDLLIARRTSDVRERKFMQTLAASFLSIGLLIFAVFVLKLGAGTNLESYLKTIANLGSLLPTALLAYHVYRYRYFELIIRQSLVLAGVAAFVLIAYLYGIRAIAEWISRRYSLRAAAVESLLILALVFLVAPVRGWIEKRFRELFTRETNLYRDVVAQISERARHYRQLPELLRFVEKRTQEALRLRSLRIITIGGDEYGDYDSEELAKELKQIAGRNDVLAVENISALNEQGFNLAYALRREDRTLGWMLVGAQPDAISGEVRAVLETLAGQMAIAIEDCRLLEENVLLERKVAEGERLAALGQMAATVAHEVKNPLSAIKSIAQVMREDESLSGEYGRDLDLIVGETNRLSRSVTQLLSFTRAGAIADVPCEASEVVRAVVELFRAEAKQRGVQINYQLETSDKLNGKQAAAIRDSLSNLILNALQAVQAQGIISIEARRENDELFISVADTGGGVPDEARERIFEPFFTTKQRGTGLGLSIVRKRIKEIGGEVTLAETQTKNESGARFELRLPLGTS
jgi:signal transduction histidine kinase